jgi:hypothetical protein
MNEQRRRSIAGHQELVPRQSGVDAESSHCMYLVTNAIYEADFLPHLVGAAAWRSSK